MTLSKIYGKDFSEKAEGKRADRPDLFDEFHRDIRTGYGESGPSYPMNYQITELLKARGETSTRALSKASRAPLPWIERGPGNVAGRTRSIRLVRVRRITDKSGNDI